MLTHQYASLQDCDWTNLQPFTVCPALPQNKQSFLDPSLLLLLSLRPQNPSRPLYPISHISSSHNDSRNNFHHWCKYFPSNFVIAHSMFWHFFVKTERLESSSFKTYILSFWITCWWLVRLVKFIKKSLHKLEWCINTSSNPGFKSTTSTFKIRLVNVDQREEYTHNISEIILYHECTFCYTKQNSYRICRSFLRCWDVEMFDSS